MRVLKVRAHNESCRAVTFINEGLVILTGSPNCSILAIDIETGSPVSYGWMFIQLAMRGYGLSYPSSSAVRVQFLLNTPSMLNLNQESFFLLHRHLNISICYQNCYFALRNNCHKRITLPYTGDKYLLHKQSTKWITVMTMAPPRLEKGVGVLYKPVIEKTIPGRESEFDLRKSRKMAPPYRVMLHNDNYNKREYVVQVLMKGNLLNIDWLMQLTRIGRDAVLYVESLIESIMGGLEGLINILDSEGASTRSQLKLQMDFDGQERYMKRSWEPSDKADLHFVYKDVEGVSTHRDDIHRKLRNLPPKPSAFEPNPFTPAEDEDSKPKTKSRIDNKTEELKDLEDDLDDSCFLEEYKYLQLP
uniref:Adaptor protein ClpS core domain-containing protein n=1 Tax=Lactuca sativa TaxID=4236 RepID=A0A9R1X3A8_LACSA|nr:hypothetical protein LSAT_V11C700387720 [Lactuca sativa]